jgi:hypothetical protein
MVHHMMVGKNQPILGDDEARTLLLLPKFSGRLSLSITLAKKALKSLFPKPLQRVVRRKELRYPDRFVHGKKDYRR